MMLAGLIMGWSKYVELLLADTATDVVVVLGDGVFVIVASLVHGCVAWSFCMVAGFLIPVRV
jgi:hypothetical protein